MKTKKPIKTTKVKSKKPTKLTTGQLVYLACHVYYFWVWYFTRPDYKTPKKLQKSATRRQTGRANDPRQANFILHPFIGKRLKLVTWVLAFLLVVVIAQLLYPRNKTLPLARLQTIGSIGYANDRDILASFADFDSRIVTVHTHGRTVTTSYRDLGVRVNYGDTVKKMTDYPLAQRLIPFSILAKTAQAYSIERSLDDAQLSLFAGDIITQVSKKPIDAVVFIGGTNLSVKASEDGYEYQTSVLKSEILRSDLGANSQIVFAPTVLKPNIPTDIATAKASNMQNRINNPLTVMADAQNITFNSEVMASWVDIVHKPENKTVDITFNKDRIISSLAGFAEKTDVAMVPAVNVLLNGNSAGRVEGVTGRYVQMTELVKMISESASSSFSNLVAPVSNVIPKETVDRRYTKDSVGVQSLLDFWARNNSGNYSIDFRSANERISASINPNQLMSGVGNYRLYIAGLVYNQLAVRGSGALQEYTILQNGQTVGDCLNRMIISSDDSCTDALGSLVGWGAGDSLLSVQGLESTTITSGAPFTTTKDATNWLQKISSAGNISYQYSRNLLDMMGGQSVRTGIPAGSPGIRVANKASSYGRISSDTAIVYNPGGTYYLAVIAEGSSLPKIADLTSEINKVMSQ